MQNLTSEPKDVKFCILEKVNFTAVMDTTLYLKYAEKARIYLPKE